MEEEKDAESSLYHSSKFTVNPKHAESSNPLCPFCNASIEPMAVLKCPKCKALLKLSPTILTRPVPEFGIPERSRSVGESARDFQGRVRVYEICEICCDRKETFEMFRNKGCRHSVCTDCISKHIQVKVESNSGVILCPGLYCRVALALDRCKEFLPEKVAERWEKAMIETMIPESEKFYCPFKDCSAMLLNEDAEEVRVIRESECPHCRRLFCVRCRVPWHSEMECQEFQKLNEDEREREDIQLKKLAEEKEWMRCPKCKFYVEKTGGCVRMKCRCRFEFCYRCGEKWSFYHVRCLAGIVHRP